MPWTGRSFAAAHNKKLAGAAAETAAAQASAMVRAGIPEGEAIATANKTGDRRMSAAERRYAPKKGAPAPRR
jgi:uncharacterized protein YdaT